MVQFLPTIQEPKSTAGRFLEGLAQGAQQIPEMIGEYKRQKQMKGLAADILAIDPENPNFQAMSKIVGSGLPAEQALPIMRMLSLVDPFKLEQQSRLSKDSVLNRYNKRIGEIDSQLKSVFGEEAEQLKTQRKALQKERDQLLGFKALNEPQEDLGEDEDYESEGKSAKIKFDANNPQHRKARDQMLKKYGGDRAKAGKALSATFDL